MYWVELEDTGHRRPLLHPHSSIQEYMGLVVEDIQHSRDNFSLLVIKENWRLWDGFCISFIAKG